MTTLSALRRVGVAIDIDGVISLAGRAFPGSRRAFELLHRARVPTAVVTNGGGTSEAAKAQSVNKSLGMLEPGRGGISGSQVVLSHSPMAALSEELRGHP
jgi:ribonucleotide monophosphatase NagD (HAD superfamily)